MPNISLSPIPCPLKTLIFENLRMEDSLRLLRVNRELRHLVLYNGLSPRMIEALDIQAIGGQITDGVMFFDEVSIELHAKSESYKFRICAHRRAPDEHGVIRITRADLRLFEKMRNVQRIDLKLDGCRESIDPPTIDLPKSLNKSTNGLMVFGAMNWNFHVINFDQIGRSGRDPTLYAALQKTNYSRLGFFFDQAEDFWASVEEFLKIGAPSRNPEAIVVMMNSSYGATDVYLEPTPEISEFLRRYTIEVDDLDEKRRVMVELSMYFVEVHETAVFRRILAENSQIFYIFHRNPSAIRFFAKVERVLPRFS